MHPEDPTLTLSHLTSSTLKLFFIFLSCNTIYTHTFILLLTPETFSDLFSLVIPWKHSHFLRIVRYKK